MERLCRVTLVWMPQPQLGLSQALWGSFHQVLTTGVGDLHRGAWLGFEPSGSPISVLLGAGFRGEEVMAQIPKGGLHKSGGEGEAELPSCTAPSSLAQSCPCSSPFHPCHPARPERVTTPVHR